MRLAPYFRKTRKVYLACATLCATILEEQDALKESFPDMPREDRQLLMLRFVREVDQSVDYEEVKTTAAEPSTRSGVQFNPRASPVDATSLFCSGRALEDPLLGDTVYHAIIFAVY